MYFKKRLKSNFPLSPYPLHWLRAWYPPLGTLSRAECNTFFWIFTLVANEFGLKKQPTITQGQVNRECLVQKSCMATNWSNCEAHKQMITCMTTTKCLQHHSWNKCVLGQKSRTRPWLSPRGQRAWTLFWMASQSCKQSLGPWLSRWHLTPAGFTPSEPLESKFLPL